MHDKIPHLQLVRPAAPPARLPLSHAAAMCVDSAELFLLSLDTEMLTADSLRSAYLLGLSEAHLLSLVALIRAVTS